MLRRTLVTTRGTVITRRNNLTDYDVKVTWLTEGANSSGMTLTFQSTERAEQSGVYLRIDPDTMAVSLPGASHEEKNNLLDGFRTRFGGSEHFASYTETEITDFPSYIYRKPGEPTAYCHKDSPDISDGR